MNKTRISKAKQSKKSKTQLIQERKAEALAIHKEMQNVEKQHRNFLNNWENISKNRKVLGKRKIADNYFEKQEKEFDKKESELYAKFYRHMHKDFNVDKSPITYTDTKKYKDGFCDERYIKDMYSHKLEKVKTKKKG